ncbi:MAG: sulfatase-like hydrolase/transferase [Deltaproteobacteria bacterium]|nr:sulfatase-like hydrolase/transferase [Deltaproteobacteria bacterium]
MVRTMKVAERVTDKALAYLDQRKTGRFFLFLHYWDPHYDYNPPKRYVDLFDPDYDGSMDGMNIRYRDDLTPTMNPRDLEHLLALYDGEIRYTDDHIGRFLDGLASRGLADTTMVVVTSDHGEEFLEHGWKGHTNHCYEETARVPLIVRVPWIETKAPAVTRLAGHPVILPTVLDALEVDGEGITLQGRSLVPLLAGRSARPRTAVICRTRYGHTAPPLASVGAWNTLIARAGMKLHRYGRDGAKATELYNVTRDPGEKTNLADVEKATAIKLTRRLDKSLAKQKREGRSTRLERRGKLKRATRRVLKSLGYTQ